MGYGAANVGQGVDVGCVGVIVAVGGGIVGVGVGGISVGVAVDVGGGSVLVGDSTASVGGGSAVSVGGVAQPAAYSIIRQTIKNFVDLICSTSFSP